MCLNDLNHGTTRNRLIAAWADKLEHGYQNSNVVRKFEYKDLSGKNAADVKAMPLDEHSFIDSD